MYLDVTYYWPTIAKQVDFFQAYVWEGMNFKSCLVFGFLAKVLLLGRDAPKAHDQESVSILNVVMVKTLYDIPLY